jgi:epothilone polyketide synthase D
MRWVLAGCGLNEMYRALEEFVFEGRFAATGSRHTSPRRVTFVFSGMGPQSGLMGRELAAQLPNFAQHVADIDEMFIKYDGASVWEALYQYKDAEQLPTALAQMGNFLLQAALYHLLVDEGIKPDALVGHSAGEVASAYAAGVYTLDEAVRVAIARGKLQASLAGRGAMLAVGLGCKEVIKLIADVPGVSIAAVNDERGVTLSGDTDEIKKLDERLKQQQVFSKMLRVEVPYHSPVMDEITHTITSELSFLNPASAKPVLYSTVSGDRSDGIEWDGGYWACNIRQPVLFADAIKLALEEGCNSFIEIAPHPVLSQSMGLLTSEYTGVSIHHLISRRENEYELFKTGISELAINGIGRPQRRPSAPLLQLDFMPQQLWDEDPDSEAQRRGDLAVEDLPMLGRRVSAAIPTFEVELSTTDYSWLSGHTVLGLGAIVPATMWSELIALALMEGEHKSVRFSNLTIVQSLPVSTNPVVVSTKVEGGIVKCLSRPVGKGSSWTLHALASISSISALSHADNGSGTNNVLPMVNGTKVDEDYLYRTFINKGLAYTGNFKNLADVTIGAGSEAWATIHSMESFCSGYHAPWVLDAGLQLLIAAAKDFGEVMYLPFRVGQVKLHRPVKAAGDYQAYAKVSVRTESELIGSVSLFDRNGHLLAEFNEITCIRNQSDDIERGNYIDRNTYAIRNLTPEEVAERARSEDDSESSREDAVVEDILKPLDEYWIADEELVDSDLSRPFKRPDLFLGDIEKGSEAHLLWMLPHQDLEADVSAAVKLIQHIGHLGIRTLTLSIIAERKQEWIAGMRRSAANSYGFTIRVIFLDDGTSHEMLEAAIAFTSEHEIVFDQNEPKFRRLEQVTSEQLRRSNSIHGATEESLPTATLTFDFARGHLNKMIAFKENLRKPGDGEVCVKVDGTGLLWKDIGKILGTIGTSTVHTFAGHHIGFGVSGVVIATGDGARFSVGDRVYGALRRPYRQYVTFDATQATLLRYVPEGVENIAMIAHAIPWITALAVFDDTTPKPGDKVFIQSGAGGAGSVLCNYAKQFGAQVVTSVGTENKVDEVKKILPDVEVIVARGGDIPDALINAGYSNFNWIISTVNGGARASLLTLLKACGDYVDLGKPGSIDETLLASVFDGNKRYRVIDIDQLSAREPGWLGTMLDRLTEKMKDSKNHLPVTYYPISEMSNALVTMAQGETTGCMAISISTDFQPPAINKTSPVMDPDGSYLITGGYGGVGLICAQWLASRGARHIILSGSSGRPTQESQAAIDLLNAWGAEVCVVKSDSTDLQSIMDLIRFAGKERKIRGIIHAAGVISDGPFDKIGAERIARSFGPKLTGAYLLVDALDALDAVDDLNFIVLTSSVSSVVGLTIQGTYAAANSGLDGFAEQLRDRGIKSCALQLGPVDAGGMAADDVVRRYYETIGLSAVSPRRLYGILDLAVEGNAPHFTTDEVDWARNSRAEPANAASSVLRHIVEEALSGANHAELEDLLALDHKDRSEVLSMMLLGIVTQALGLEEGYLEVDSNFAALGIDSLAIMEVQAGINGVLHQDLPLTQMFTQDGTIAHLASRISEYLGEQSDVKETAA